MYYLIEYLKKERHAFIEKIKAGNHEQVKFKVEIDHAISWLEIIAGLELKHPQSYEIIKLPDLPYEFSGLFSEYHIMNDYENANVEDWDELKDEQGNPITLVMGDVLIRSK